MPKPPPTCPSNRCTRRRVAPEHAGDLVPVPVRHLGGAVQFQHVAGSVVARNRAAGLERHARMPADRQRRRHHRMRGAECRIDVAVALAHDGRFGRAAGLEFAGRLRRPGGSAAIPRCRAIDKLGRVLGEIWIVGENGGDGVADIAHASRRRTAAGGKPPGPRCGSSGNRSARCRRHRPPSTRHARRQARAPPSRRSPATCRGRNSSARCACAIGGETKYRRRSGRAR